MSLSIQYISKNNEIEKVENKEQVPEHAAFIWYDYDSFDDKAQLKRNHDLDDIRLEDEAIKTYRPAYYKNDDYQLLICHVIDRQTLEAHAVNVCIMQDVIIFSEEMIDEIKDNYMSYNTYRMNRIINSIDHHLGNIFAADINNWNIRNEL